MSSFKKDEKIKDDVIIKDESQQRNQEQGIMIKIDSHLDRVSADINNYTQLLGALEKRLFLNSVLSYVIFFILVMGLSHLIFRERNQSLVTENKLLKTTIEVNSDKIAELNDKINGFKTTNDKAEQLLDEFFNTTSDPKKLVDDFEALDKGFFSKVEIAYFQERVVKLKTDLSVKFYENGKNYFDSNSYPKAAAELLESLKYNPKNPYINEINFYLGVSYLRMKKYSESIPYLEKAMINNLDKSKADDILFYLGSAYERLSNYSKARDYYKKIIDEYTTSDKFWDAKKQYIILEKQ